MTVVRSDVEFPAHDGTTLRGWLYLPDPDSAQHPGVVMAHGFSATKEMALDRYAELIAEGGVGVLVYDHRYLGASDGEPRQLIDPWIQARDFGSALDWLARHDRIDPARLGIWGSSLSGGLVLVVGAADSRVRAVVANVPFVGRPGSAAGADDDRFEQLVAAVREASPPSPEDASGLVEPLAVVAEDGVDGPVAMPFAEAAEWFLDAGRRPGSRWQNRVWSRVGTNIADFDPALALPHLRAATLLVLASEDRLAPTADGLAAFELLQCPRDLLVIEGHHFTPYSGEALVRAATAARDFYQRWL